MFLGNHNKTFICKLCLNFYTNENTLLNHKEQCGESDICTIRTSPESHLHWKDHFHKNPLYFTFIADFEADSEIDNFSTDNKTTNSYKQNSGT